MSKGLSFALLFVALTSTSLVCAFETYNDCLGACLSSEGIFPIAHERCELAWNKDASQCFLCADGFELETSQGSCQGTCRPSVTGLPFSEKCLHDLSCVEGCDMLLEKELDMETDTGMSSDSESDSDSDSESDSESGSDVDPSQSPSPSAPAPLPSASPTPSVAEGSQEVVQADLRLEGVSASDLESSEARAVVERQIETILNVAEGSVEVTGVSSDQKNDAVTVEFNVLVSALDPNTDPVQQVETAFADTDQIVSGMNTAFADAGLSITATGASVSNVSEQVIQVSPTPSPSGDAPNPSSSPSPTAASPSPSAVGDDGDSDGDGDDDDLGAGAIAGIVIGGLVCVGASLVCFVMFTRKSNQRASLLSRVEADEKAQEDYKSSENVAL